MRVGTRTLCSMRASTGSSAFAFFLVAEIHARLEAEIDATCHDPEGDVRPPSVGRR